ncbi:MAG TPA: hypothetical protein ENN67_08525 [Firmicutes bacterium]|nr:hypothetical protein [Bacillota bacterium]
MTLKISQTMAGIAIFLLLLSLGCGTETTEKQPEGIDFLERTELMGIPRNGNRFDPVGGEVVPMKLGKEVRRAIEFPAEQVISFNLQDIPAGAQFTGAVGIKTFVSSIPQSRFQIARRTAAGVETILETIIIQAGEDESWQAFSVPLDEYKGLSITLTVNVFSNQRTGKAFIANPRVVLPKPDTPRQAVLICIDTLRADHLGSYGFELPLTPSLDNFASEGVRFENCNSACPWTLPSVAAVFTSKYPGQIAADSTTEQLRDEETTLPELFQKKGFRTASITNNHYVSSEVGFFQGVEYQHESPRAPADEQYGWALDWINEHINQDFFIYIHLFDPHLPYEPPEPFLSQYKKGSGRFETRFSEVTEYREGSLILTDDEKEQIHGLYLGCVAYADEETGKFFDELKRLGIWDDMAVVVFADHGEEFWEHGGFEHGHSMYQEVTHVPLIAKFPGRNPDTVSHRVSLIDIMPTFIQWANLETPHGIMGRDLFNMELIDDSNRRLIIEECIHTTESKACIQNDWKQIVHFDGLTEPELFNLTADPLEKDNCFGYEETIANELATEIVLYSAQTSEGCHLRVYPTDEASNGIFKVTASTDEGVFSEVSGLTTGTIESRNVGDKSVEFRAQFRRGGYFGLDFMIEPEDARVTFSVIFEDNPDIQLPWYLGASGTMFLSNEYTLGMTDPRITLSYPQARLTNSQGVFIWTVPPSIRANMVNELSPEMIEELVSLGYITRD